MELVESRIVRSIESLREKGHGPLSYTHEKRLQGSKLPFPIQIGKITYYHRSELAEKGIYVADEDISHIDPDSETPTDHTIQDICQVCQITPPTVYSLIKSGRLKSYKVGRATRITRESFDQLRKGVA